MKKQLLSAALALSALTSFGSGYLINLEGLRQVAMGGTGTAVPWDVSTIFYNPAGLSGLKGIQAYASIATIMPGTAFGNVQSSAKSVSQTFTPFNIYVGGPIQKGSKFAIGLGVYTPAGTGLDWGNSWSGRYIIEDIELRAVFFQPTLSYRINDKWSAGAGFIYATGTLDIKNALPVGGANDSDGQAHLHGTANGVGFNAGVHYKLNDHLQIGLTYRSQVNMSLSGGSANFTAPASLATSFPNTQFDSQLPIPQVASIGVGYQTGDLMLQLDLNYTGWNSYDSLRINFSQQTAALQNEHEPRHYRNTLTPRIGANYKISKMISVMAGAAYDPTPVVNGYVSPDLPDADRIVLTAGISVKPFPHFTILAAFEGTNALKRNANYDYANFNGTYKTEAATTGIGITYNF
jgi:long-chain fatty acid transport protein